VAELGALVSILKAAGEGTRLRLLLLLSEGQHSVKDLTEILGQSQPRVSRHLKLLADAGLVSRQAEGAWAYYALTEKGAAADLVRWLVERSDADDPERLRDIARLASVREANQQQAAGYFAKVAASWDLQRTLHIPEAAVENALLEQLAGRRVDLMLDLGTGTGRMLELLAGHYRRGVGIDSSREMIAVARARLASAAIVNAQVRLGDIGNLDPALGGADLIVIHQVLHYFDDPGRLFGQVAQALSPAGEMLIVDFAPHQLEFLRTEHQHRRMGLSDRQVENWARSAGLDQLATRSFPSGSGDAGLTVKLWHFKNNGGVRADEPSAG